MGSASITTPMSAAVSVAASDGCRLATWLEGPGDAPFLVLSNSLGTNVDMWNAQREDLLPHFRLLRYDARGHGQSDSPPGDYTIERLARDVLDVLDAHRVDRASFLGLSMGGMVGQWLGAHAATRLDRLVLANTAASMGPASAWDTRMARVRADGMAAIADDVVARWFTPEFLAASPVDVNRIREMLLATSPVGYVGCCAAIRNLDLVASAARIEVPTLIIAGTRDPATPAERSEQIAGAMGGRARVVRLPAAHLSNVEQPDAFNRAVLEFLS